MRLHGQKVFRPALPIGLFPYCHSRARPSIFDSGLIIYVMISKANQFRADNNLKESGWIDRLFCVLLFERSCH